MKGQIESQELGQPCGLSKTHDEIITDLRKTAQAPLGRRTLAGMVREGMNCLNRVPTRTWED